MKPSLVFNPMTSARLILKDGEPEALSIHCYARRRSHCVIRIERSLEPAVFDLVFDWLNGKGATSALNLDMQQKLHFWSKGLLISPDECKEVPPGARPELSDGHQLAVALCPELTSLLRDGPSLTAIPGEPDKNFADSGFCSVPPVIGADDIAAMNSYYGALSDGDWLSLEGAPGNRGVHNDPAARRVQFALTPYFAALLGKDIMPSYTYAREYSQESPLPRHTDRKQCEFTFSLYVDYQPEPESKLCPWPLIVHGPDGDVVANQRLGGGLVICGRTLPHSRPPLPPGHRARMAFLHYVSTSFADSLD